MKIILCFIFIFCSNSLGFAQDIPKDGVYKKTYPKLGMWDESTYKNGVKEGPYKAYWNNGKLQLVVNYKHNMPDGIMKYYDENGKILNQDVYRGGLLLDDKGNPLNGIHKLKTLYGAWLEQCYVNGELDGITQMYGNGGKLLGEKKYVQGKMVAYKTIAPDIGGPHEWTPMKDPDRPL